MHLCMSTMCEKDKQCACVCACAICFVWRWGKGEKKCGAISSLLIIFSLIVAHFPYTNTEKYICFFPFFLRLSLLSDMLKNTKRKNHSFFVIIVVVIWRCVVSLSPSLNHRLFLILSHFLDYEYNATADYTIYTIYIHIYPPRIWIYGKRLHLPPFLHFTCQMKIMMAIIRCLTCAAARGSSMANMHIVYNIIQQTTIKHVDKYIYRTAKYTYPTENVSLLFRLISLRFPFS